MIYGGNVRMTRHRYVRGQLAVEHHWRPVRKKQSQTKPLRLSTLESETYAVSEQNEPIEVKWLCFSLLHRKKADFSTKINGTPLTTPDLLERKLEDRNSKIEEENRELRMKLECPLE